MSDRVTLNDRVSISITDGVADVRMARPDKLNALDPAMFEGLTQAGRALAEDPSVRVVVLSGEGRAFCAGLDMGSFQRMAGSDSDSDRPRGERPSAASLVARDESGPANRAQLAAWIWQEIPAPVIGAIHGVAYGGGTQIALGCDIRFIAPDARMSVMEVKWGLIPDMAISQTLRHVGRLDVAKELTYTGRIISGAEAVELGLATHLADDPLAAATELAREIASKSPDAIRPAKRLFNTAVNSGVREGLELEEQLQLSLMGTPNQVEAVMSNFEKRDARFKDPQ
jgi:enoyl-CoA hydratase/carnithine racemase